LRVADSELTPVSEPLDQPPADAKRLKPAVPTSVLFACNLNSTRSPMAEALTRHFFGHRLYAESVGVRAGETNPMAVAVMDEIGIDLAAHKPQSFSDLEDLSFDLIISLTPEAHHQAAILTRMVDCDIEYWPTPDPTLVDGSRETLLQAYRDLRDELQKKIVARFGTGPAPNV
jgi:protein-tyrosine-phosphatase